MIKQHWQYFVAPAFVARMSSDSLEVLDFKTKTWQEDIDPTMRESLIKDCTVVSEEEALEIGNNY